MLETRCCEKLCSDPLNQAWVSWYRLIQDDIIASGVAVSLVYNFAFVGSAIFLVIISRIPFFEKYKIQKVRMRPQYLPTTRRIKQVIVAISQSSRAVSISSNLVAPTLSLHDGVDLVCRVS